MLGSKKKPTLQGKGGGISYNLRTAFLHATCWKQPSTTWSCFHFIIELLPQIGLTIFIFKPLFKTHIILGQCNPSAYSYCRNYQCSSGRWNIDRVVNLLVSKQQWVRHFLLQHGARPRRDHGVMPFNTWKHLKGGSAQCSDHGRLLAHTRV